MTEPKQPITLDEAIERADQIATLVHSLRADLSISDDFEERLTETKHYGSRNRFYIALLALSLVFDLGITGYLVGQNHRVDHNTKVALAASSAAARLKESDRTRCEAGNEFRTADRARWNYILNLAPPPTTPEAAARLAKFQGFIDTADRLRNCPT